MLGSRRDPAAALPSAVQTCRSDWPCGAKLSCSPRDPEAAAPPRAAFAGADGSAVPHAPGPWWWCVVSACVLLCFALGCLKIASIWRARSNSRRRGPAVPMQIFVQHSRPMAVEVTPGTTVLEIKGHATTAMGVGVDSFYLSCNGQTLRDAWTIECAPLGCASGTLP